MPYIEGMADAPGGLNESMAQIAAGVAQAYAATTIAQGQAHDFYAEYGADVTPGHGAVGRPGAMGDPDPTLDAADG